MIISGSWIDSNNVQNENRTAHMDVVYKLSLVDEVDVVLNVVGEDLDSLKLTEFDNLVLDASKSYHGGQG
eukprot:CAMPEP_0116870716 /NCGR_PEP_ID=MMETSP0463-20121206/747_1 /TAXON_ID=181622 /ORGANISM="Strombidinopsis sp, Strain SopsisLIS2011" /LENGTH=69 /DNA_ID=CAMNT_0004507777 /DNA_START=382 /DNA_END=591 /DNA_ORIENTATION=-